MELRICCDAQVKLDKMTNVNEIFCDIDTYQVNGDTLDGNILIRGNYIKDDMNLQYDFNELVPFTIVFKDRNYQINNIGIQDFSYQEIINQGIECNFSILVDYLPIIGEQNSEVNEDDVEKTKMELEEVSPKEETIVNDEGLLDNQEIPIGEDGETIAVILEEPDDIVISDETIKAEINQKYNDLLNEILEARADDNFFEVEKEKAITINSDKRKGDCRGFLNNIKNEQKSVKIYYTNREVDIEKICKNERVSVDKVYRDNQKSDFINKRRIIIK